MPRSKIANEQAKDSDFAFQAELDGVKEDDNPGAFVQATMNNYDLWLRIGGVENLANDSNFSFFNPSASKDYIEISSTSYVLVATFIFRGTDIWTPQQAVMALSRKGTTGTSYVRLYDATNSNIIFEFSYSALTRDIYQTTAISNLPAGVALFEMQLQTTSPAGATRIHAIGFYPNIITL